MAYLVENGELIANRWEVVRPVGRGTVGEGYLCHDPHLGIDVVCKVALSSDKATVDHFRAQFGKLVQIQSRGVVRPLGFDLHEGRPVVVLEWIGGTDLDEWQPGRSLKERLAALVEISAALLELHEAGLTHGDLHKGVNILAGSARGCVLIDPEPAAWGSVSSGAERVIDAAAFASVIELLAYEYKSTRLKPVIDQLMADGSTESLRAATSALVAVAKAPPVAADWESTYRARGAAYQVDVRAANRQYKVNRITRRSFFATLVQDLRDVAAGPDAYGLEVSYAEVDETVEAARDERGLGTLLPRVIVCKSSVTRAFLDLRFDGCEDFDKPWCYDDGVFATGEWFVSVNNLKRTHGRIQLVQGADDRAYLIASPALRDNLYGDPAPDPPHDEYVLLDRGWLMQRVLDMTGSDRV